jgi:hypothetical protein
MPEPVNHLNKRPDVPLAIYDRTAHGVAFHYGYDYREASFACREGATQSFRNGSAGFDWNFTRLLDSLFFKERTAHENNY